MFLAHKNDISVQTLEDHLSNVAILAMNFGIVFDSAEIAYLTGYLHDYGKYTEGFQRRINGEDIRTEHAFHGAVKAFRNYPLIGKLMAYCIAGHHGGLPNGADTSESCLNERLKRNIGNLPELDLKCCNPKPKQFKSLESFYFTVYVRMLFSCLVDADYLDTEKFMDVEKHSQRICETTILTMKSALDKYIEKRFDKKTTDRINQLRTEIYNACIEKSKNCPGFFSLNVPTGSGKTLSSIAFALNHAVEHKKKRIIYVIPYTSIIEQTADTFRQIFGNENVLEHHSNFDGKTVYGENDDKLTYRMRLASENWDAPIVVTTSVQFFESFFSNKPSKCRKLHNCADSVIIFDEVQMIPYDLFLPCIKLLKCLTDDYKVTTLVCSATQPVLNSNYLNSHRIENVTELVENSDYYQEQFRRTKLSYIGELTDDHICNLIDKEKASLTIVNTKKHANKLFSLLKDKRNIYHLSTLMCPVHRKETLETIRKHLFKEEECTVISTQLIEAGVDVDFPTVFRCEAGIDSIAQSAGRCNRNGKLPELGNVIIFSSADNPVPRMFRQYVQTGAEVIRNFPDILSKEAVSSYFERLYKDKGESQLDRFNILNPDYQNLRQLDFPFKDIAEKFRMIDTPTQPVIIPFNEEAEYLIAQLYQSEFTSAIQRQLQKYTVQLHQAEYERIEPKLTKVQDKFAIANKDIYDYRGKGLMIYEDYYKEEDFII